jgi:hypothetical protein
MSRRPSDDDLLFLFQTQTTAWHEAAHAVTALTLGFPVKEVRVRDGADRAAGILGCVIQGCGHADHPLDGGSVRACREQLKVYVAGCVGDGLGASQQVIGEPPPYREVVGEEYMELTDEPREGSDEAYAIGYATMVIQARVVFPKALEHFRSEFPDRGREWYRVMARAFACSTQPSPDQLEEEIRLAERSVARLLRREWAAVNKLAQALDRRGRLTGRQVGRLLAA